ncbi:15883_t:CDS:1 [Funneliformis geosporum]|uniref:16238_t:CDS:1 n=1 Tax=Funneliformis geosporum TaxID=1117311 RepID=A0A9W4SVG4_9GLOM|nr:15883_t:CDS:1 [Funneliformis geosporum]CAI2183062.1 16238_t:CDS:1 [Funneliformis geosporum]
MANLVKGPSRSLYKEFNPTAYFSYQPGRKSFQQGYLGITNNVSIVGFLHIRNPANQPLYAKRIQICFLGTEFIQLQETGPKVLTYSTSSICNIIIELWKSPNDDYYEIHDMDLPFEIPLPLDLPSSISLDKERGKIQYSLRAIISKKPNIKLFRGSTKIIQCAYTVDRYTLPPLPLPEPKKWTKESPIKRGIGYEISLNNSVFGPRYPIVVRLKLTFYDSRVSLEDIVVGLKEYTFMGAQSDSKNKSKYIGRKIVRGKQITMSSDSQYSQFTTDIKFSIPEDCIGKLSWSNEGFNIKVTHKVKIKVKFGLFSKYNIDLATPVKILNMLNVEEEAYLAAEILHQQDISRYSEPEILSNNTNTPPPTYEPDWFANQTSLPDYSSI